MQRHVAQKFSYNDKKSIIVDLILSQKSGIIILLDKTATKFQA